MCVCAFVFMCVAYFDTDSSMFNIRPTTMAAEAQFLADLALCSASSISLTLRADFAWGRGDVRVKIYTLMYARSYIEYTFAGLFDLWPLTVDILTLDL